MTTYQKACKNALDVQDACNFSGVLLSFASDMEAVRAHLHELGIYSSSTFATHPVALMYMDKLADLQGRPDSMVLFDAYEKVREVISEVSEV